MERSTSIPCMLIRGGTSKGAYFLASDLPENEQQRDDVLIHVMGSGDPQQINGIGGGTSLTSKVAIVSKSAFDNVDLDYLFAQVGVEDRVVDTKPSCGNILSGILIFGDEKGLITLQDPETTIRVRNINTNTIIEVTAETPNGKVKLEGNVKIDGVPETGSPILLNFLNVGGAKTGKLFPTGRFKDDIQGVTVSCIDASVPMVHIPAKAMGKTGYETKTELDADAEFLQKLESIRREAGERMGLGDVSNSVIPKVSLVAPPANGGNITSRYFVPHNCHASHAVTGAICVAVSTMLAGTVAYEAARNLKSNQIEIEHPAGKIAVSVVIEANDEEPQIRQAALVRTARPLFKGDAYY
ncbi:4-oxalomesaconate tautomerase [Enterovibrio norvegicus]|uniref:4-oxalomesaconate tautomerase n=1 Tax=Enterovibrio norvegicus TaxID=188144 RepID=UPI0002EFFC1A|nr:4-oxalomesaconate tautomerase [Enterovibrio norvegicus]